LRAPPPGCGSGLILAEIDQAQNKGDKCDSIRKSLELSLRFLKELKDEQREGVLS
jgi:hypothetical protein